MADLLVKLYELPDSVSGVGDLLGSRVRIRRAARAEASLVQGWVGEHFWDEWARAAFVSVLREPASCWLAVELAAEHVRKSPYDRVPERLVGFACYDVDAKGMFGPIGVRQDERNRGVGSRLLVRTLMAMRDEGYVYAVVGWAGPVAWYERTVDASVIPGSEPGVFDGVLRVEVVETPAPE